MSRALNDTLVIAERSLLLIPLLLLTAWAVYRSAELALERHQEMWLQWSWPAPV